jgi:fumarylpyruvate hydrolase
MGLAPILPRGYRVPDRYATLVTATTQQTESTMKKTIFPPRPTPVIPVTGDAGFPVGRIFCVGRNYADHAAEMGHAVDREAPFYFTKSAHAVLLSGQDMPYPPRTQDLHHEMELVVALGAGGVNVAQDGAMDLVFGYGCGLDMTRRDLQAAAKDKRRPWDTGKDFDNAAILGPLTPKAGDISGLQIALTVNGAVRQSGKLADMVWSVPEIIADLSTLYTLQAGDLIMTGTPAGVGPVVAGDVLRGTIGDFAPVETRIV